MNSWFVAVEGISSWSALDVFTVSIFAAVLQIERFADVIVASVDLPGVLDPLLEAYGGLFEVTASVNGVFAMLIISSIGLFVMNSRIQARVSAKLESCRASLGMGNPKPLLVPAPQNLF
jgi:hypothetical protein